MEPRRLILRPPKPGPHRASRGAKLASESESELSPVKTHPENRRSTSPSPRSAPYTPSHSNRPLSTSAIRRRNPRSTQAPLHGTRIRRSKMRGAKIESESDSSPTKAKVGGNPRPEAAPPSQRPALGPSAAAPPPPAALRCRPIVENPSGRRLPKWAHRCLPDYFYKKDISAVGVLIRARAEEARLRKAAEAQSANGDKALEDGVREEDEEEGETWEDEVPWCGGRTGSA